MQQKLENFFYSLIMGFIMGGSEFFSKFLSGLSHQRLRVYSISFSKIRNILVFVCSLHIPKFLLETEVDKMMKFVDQNQNTSLLLTLWGTEELQKYCGKCEIIK